MVTTAVFDHAFRTVYSDPAAFRDRVHEFRVEGDRSTTALENVQFVVTHEGQGKGHGVRLEHVCGQQSAPSSLVLAYPGDMLGVIAGMVCPPMHSMVNN